MNNKKLYAQMWSVRDYAEKDFFGTLKALAEMGYDGVEFAGYYGTTATDLRKKLDELNLKAVSAHIGYQALKDDIDKELEYLNILGAPFIVCPGAEVKSIESALKFAEEFNLIGEKAKKAGLTFGYHNHAHELVLEDGKYPLEVLFENASPENLVMQPDLYWVAYAGLDPIEYVIKHQNRIPIVHFKQIENMETKENVDAGSGIIDFKKVSEILPSSVYIYEQEHYVGTSIENMKKSIEFLRR